MFLFFLFSILTPCLHQAWESFGRRPDVRFSGFSPLSNDAHALCNFQDIWWWFGGEGDFQADGERNLTNNIKPCFGWSSDGRSGRGTQIKKVRRSRGNFWKLVGFFTSQEAAAHYPFSFPGKREDHQRHRWSRSAGSCIADSPPQISEAAAALTSSANFSRHGNVLTTQFKQKMW